MADELNAIFKQHMPSIAERVRGEFVEEMLGYYNEFKLYQESEMNYERNPKYTDMLYTLTVLDKDEYWLYSPQFKKTMALMIGSLFRTKITDFSLSTPVSVSQDFAFVDAGMHRWMMTFAEVESEPGKLHICIRFPQSRSFIQRAGIMTDKKAGRCHQPMLVCNVSQWHAPVKVSAQIPSGCVQK